MKVQLLTPLQLKTDYNKKWLYEYTAPMSYYIEGVTIPNCNVSHRERLLGDVRGNLLTIHKGYAFDGMTNFPDTPDNMPAAGLHDFLYQTKLVSRRHADQLLAACMKTTGADHRRIVYAGVRLFGWAFYGEQKEIRIVKV